MCITSSAELKNFLNHLIPRRNAIPPISFLSFQRRPYKEQAAMLREARHSPSSPPYPVFYGRRSSPPGSPGTKRCCYEGNRRRPSSSSPNDELLCCCYPCPAGKGRPASALTTLGVCCLVLGYTMIGAFAFAAIEGGGGGGSRGGGGGERGSVAASKAEPEGEDAAGEVRLRVWLCMSYSFGSMYVMYDR